MDHQVTLLLQAVERGDRQAGRELLELVYDDLRRLAHKKMAGEKPGQTLEATALVHEAYLRLVGDQPGRGFEHRGHFFACAAEAMRRILVDAARRKQSQKHGGDIERRDLEPDLLANRNVDPSELLAIHEALDSLTAKSPRAAELVKLRYFLGCTIAEAAETLGIAVATANEDWTYARVWLRRQLQLGTTV